MTNPTPLSPAAQAVRDAALATYDNSIPKDNNLWALDRASVVAALRAAAWQLREAYENEECVPSADDWLDDLATELENYQ